jgi:hypothetical protein
MYCFMELRKPRLHYLVAPEEDHGPDEPSAL